MTTISIQEAQSNPPQLIHDLTPGEEVVITENEAPVARLVPAVSPLPRQPRRPGTLRGTVLYVAPDVDTALDDFKDDMQ